MKRLALAILAICSLSFSGCGTFYDGLCGPGTDHIYYRGVRFDILVVQEGGLKGGLKVFMAADIPFSFVADTLRVPFIAYDHMKNPRPKLSELREANRRKSEKEQKMVGPHPEARELDD